MDSDFYSGREDLSENASYNDDNSAEVMIDKIKKQSKKNKKFCNENCKIKKKLAHFSDHNM